MIEEMVSIECGCGLLFSGYYFQQLDFMNLHGTTVSCNTENHKRFSPSNRWPTCLSVHMLFISQTPILLVFICVLSLEFFLFSYLLLTFLWEYVVMTFVLLYIFVHSIKYFVLKVKWLYRFVDLSFINHIVWWKAFYLCKINVIYHLLLFYLNCGYVPFRRTEIYFDLFPFRCIN